MPTTAPGHSAHVLIDSHNRVAAVFTHWSDAQQMIADRPRLGLTYRDEPGLLEMIEEYLARRRTDEPRKP